jgi:hypothetical protein
MRTKLLHFFAAAALLACITNSARALTVPVAQDTYSGVTGELTNAAGKAASLTVTDNQTALLEFDLSNLDVVPATIQPGNVTSAILVLYVISTTSTDAELNVHAVTSPWSETFAGTKKLLPSIDSTVLARIPMAELPPPATKGFVSVDITAPVVAALTSATNLSLAIKTPTQKARVVLGSKDGPAQGYAAFLEIETATGVQNKFRNPE